MATQPRPVSYFLMVSTGVFLATMDSSMINVALPFIMESFASTLERVEWVVLIYLLTITVSLLIWGQISDRIGKAVVYLAGMLVFAIGSLCSCFAQHLDLLIVSRFVQGIGAAMMMSTGPAIIRMALPQEQIGKWLGLLGVATSLGLMSGPLVGGFLIHHFGWRTIFLINVPVSFSVFVWGWISLAGTLPKLNETEKRFDWRGCLYWSIVLVCTVLLLNRYHLSNSLIKIAGPFVIVFLGYVFVRHEGRINNPLFPVRLLGQRYYRIAMISVAMSFAVLFVVLILMPFYLLYVQGYTSDKVGYMMMAIPVSLCIVSPMSGRLFDRFGARYLTTSGLLISSLAILLLVFLPSSATPWDIAWRLSLLGCGQSVFLSPNTASVLARVSFEHTGTTSGMLATCRNLGMLTGVALAAMMFESLFYSFSEGLHLIDFTSRQIPAFMQAFRITLGLAAVIALLSALISVRRE